MNPGVEKTPVKTGLKPLLEAPAWGSWLPDMDLNHDKQIQSLLCYRYTIGQAGSGREASQVRF
ncbi:MAG: hypothetical protein RLZ45_1641 [Verrucomicrobiota bacterium]|jgi:hypothetical protein